MDLLSTCVEDWMKLEGSIESRLEVLLPRNTWILLVSWSTHALLFTAFIMYKLATASSRTNLDVFSKF